MRPFRLHFALLSTLAGSVFLAACGGESLAGKTTTTTNGGLVALGPDGAARPGCVALAARGWDALSGRPVGVDTLRSDADGRIEVPEGISFLEIRDSSAPLGARVLPGGALDKIRREVRLDTLREVRGTWPDRAGTGGERLVLDSSFQTAAVRGSDGAFTFPAVPAGRYQLSLDPGQGPIRPMGSFVLSKAERRFEGPGNVVIADDTTGSPLWIDDFEAASKRSLLGANIPGASPWYMWWMGVQMSLPTSVEPDSIPRAIGLDSTRPGKVFHARFVSQDASAWVALGLTNLRIDLRARRQVCFAYRTDGSLRVEFQMDSVGNTRPTLLSSLPSSGSWIDTCLATSAFAPVSDTPDSLSTWPNFARRVLVIQFSALTGSFLDLDDIRLR